MDIDNRSSLTGVAPYSADTIISTLNLKIAKVPGIDVPSMLRAR